MRFSTGHMTCDRILTPLSFQISNSFRRFLSVHVDFHRHAAFLLVHLSINVHGLFHFLCIVILFYNLYVVFQLTLLNYADPCRNWTFQRLTRVAEERYGTNH